MAFIKSDSVKILPSHVSNMKDSIKLVFGGFFYPTAYKTPKMLEGFTVQTATTTSSYILMKWQTKEVHVYRRSIKSFNLILQAVLLLVTQTSGLFQIVQLPLWVSINMQQRQALLFAMLTRCSAPYACPEVNLFGPFYSLPIFTHTNSLN